MCIRDRQSPRALARGQSWFGVAINQWQLCIKSHLIGPDSGTRHESSIVTATVNKKQETNQRDDVHSLLAHPGLELYELLVLGYLIQLVSTIISPWQHLTRSSESSLDDTDQKAVSTNNSIVATSATSPRVLDRAIADSFLLSVN